MFVFNKDVTTAGTKEALSSTGEFDGLDGFPITQLYIYPKTANTGKVYLADKSTGTKITLIDDVWNDIGPVHPSVVFIDADTNGEGVEVLCY